MKTLAKVVGISLLGLALFYGLFIWQFPYDQVKTSIVQGFEKVVPLRLSIGRVGPGFPLRLIFENIRFQSSTFVFQVPDLQIRPHLGDFLLGRKEFDLEDTQNSQRIHAEFSQEKNQGLFKVRLNGVEIKTSSPDRFSLSLTLSGEASFRWMGDEVEKGRGQAWALLERGEIQGQEVSLVPLPLTLFETMRAEMQIQEGVLRVKKLQVSGKDLKASLPQDFTIPLRGGTFPQDLGFIFQLPPR